MCKQGSANKPDPVHGGRCPDLNHFVRKLQTIESGYFSRHFPSLGNDGILEAAAKKARPSASSQRPSAMHSRSFARIVRCATLFGALSVTIALLASCGSTPDKVGYEFARLLINR
jgi:hypothetical protein